MTRAVEHNIIDKVSPPAVRASPQLADSARPASAGLRLWVVFFVLMALMAEFITAYVDVLPGAALHGILLFSYVNLAYFSPSGAGRRIYTALALVPLLRILSLAMPIQQVAPIFRYVMTGIPLMLAAVMVIRANGLPSLRLNLTWLEWVFQALIGASGIPLGLIASLTLVPPPEMISEPNLLWILALWIVYTLFGAVMEEIIFRGIIQTALSYSFGFFSVTISSILFAAMFLGTLSPRYIIVYGVAGLLFGVWAHLSNSLIGVIVAHSLMNIVFLLFFHLF